MDHSPATSHVSKIACPRCGRDWLRLWALPDDRQVYVCDECRAVCLATDPLVSTTHTCCADFLQDLGLDPTADVFRPVEVAGSPWSVDPHPT
ncbi:hypothetical protein V3N99_17445 [Dermatophilaceae bacterium Soc4.6]